MDRSLAGETVLCLGGANTIRRVADLVRGLGGYALPVAAFHLVMGDRAALQAAVMAVAHGDYVGMCLTSAAGVVALRQAMDAVGHLAPECLGKLLVGSVGPGTTRTLIREIGRPPDIQPTVSTGAALGRAFPCGSGRMLLPVSDLASGSLEIALRHRGYTPVRITAYRNRGATKLTAAADAAIRRGAVGTVALTSPSAVRALVRLIPPERRAPLAMVAIGPSTSAACRGAGLPVVAEARSHDVDGLVQALLETAASGV